jgi:sigma-B regulation protein RsbU (phosphoserine phosphatase)
MQQKVNYNVKILVIDDDRITQNVLRKALEGQGYKVIIASSGSEGIELVKKHHPALIICDWQMEEMNGLEVCNIIKDDRHFSDIFFILLTARTSVEDRVKGLDTGADEFLSKPVEIIELKARVRAGLRLYDSNQKLKKLAGDLQLQKQLLENELNQAAEYVKSILPQPMSGLITINSRFLPSVKLGGDCFDFYWLDEDNLVIYLLDVSGHGLAAALPSIYVHNLLRQGQIINPSNFYQPAKVLGSLNELFQMDQHNGQYFTIWYGVFNRNSRQLTYCTAGHPPGLLISQSPDSSREIKRLITPSMPIGTFPETEYENAVCTIEPSNILYIFSDGIYEIKKSDGNMWDLNKFIELVKKQPFETDIDQILENIKKETTTSFTDDCSLLEIDFSALAEK